MLTSPDLRILPTPKRGYANTTEQHTGGGVEMRVRRGWEEEDTGQRWTICSSLLADEIGAWMDNSSNSGWAAGKEKGDKGAG